MPNRNRGRNIPINTSSDSEEERKIVKKQKRKVLKKFKIPAPFASNTAGFRNCNVPKKLMSPDESPSLVNKSGKSQFGKLQAEEKVVAPVKNEKKGNSTSLFSDDDDFEKDFTIKPSPLGNKKTNLSLFEDSDNFDLFNPKTEVKHTIVNPPKQIPRRLENPMAPPGYTCKMPELYLYVPLDPWMKELVKSESNPPSVLSLLDPTFLVSEEEEDSEDEQDFLLFPLFGHREPSGTDPAIEESCAMEQKPTDDILEEQLQEDVNLKDSQPIEEEMSEVQERLAADGEREQAATKMQAVFRGLRIDDQDLSMIREAQQGPSK